MKYDEVLKDEVVRRAEGIGFMAFGENTERRKHFNWFMPDSNILGDHTFEVHYYKNVPSYTVDHQTTTYAPRALEWLTEIFSGVAQ